MKRMSIKKILEEKAPVIDKAIERYVPRRYNKKSLFFTLGPPRYDPEEVTFNEKFGTKWIPKKKWKKGEWE